MKRNILTGMSVLLIAIAAATAIYMTGCTWNNSESVREKAVKMLAGKYGDDTIAYSGSYGGGAASANSTSQMLCTSDNFSDAVIWASYDKETGELVSDNYLAVKYQDSVNTLIEEILADAFSDAVCYYESDDNVTEGLGVTLPADTTFEEYIAAYSPGLHMLAWVEAEHEWSEEEVTEALERSIVERNACFSYVQVCFFDTMEYDAQIAGSYSDRSKLTASNKYSNIFSASMDDTSSFAETEWEDSE